MFLCVPENLNSFFGLLGGFRPLLTTSILQQLPQFMSRIACTSSAPDACSLTCNHSPSILLHQTLVRSLAIFLQVSCRLSAFIFLSLIVMARPVRNHATNPCIKCSFVFACFVSHNVCTHTLFPRAMLLPRVPTLELVSFENYSQRVLDLPTFACH